MDALVRLADEVDDLGRRLTVISTELRTLSHPHTSGELAPGHVHQPDRPQRQSTVPVHGPTAQSPGEPDLAPEPFPEPRAAQSGSAASHSAPDEEPVSRQPHPFAWRRNWPSAAGEPGSEQEADEPFPAGPAQGPAEPGDEWMPRQPVLTASYSAPPPYPQPYPMYPSPAPPKRPTFVERLGKDGAGSRLLAWIGGAVTLLGVVLLLVLAVQRGWLGPLPRVLAGAAFGGVLIGVGVWVHRSANGRTGAFALAATGIAALYLDAIAATVLYGYLSTVGGLVAGLGVAVGGLLLAARWDSPVLGTAVVAGCAVCAPMITEGVTPLVVAFLLMLQIATTPVQLWKAWPSLALAAGTAPLLASVLSTAHGADPIANAWAAVAAMTVGVVLALVQAKRRVNDQVAAELLVWTAAPALLSAVLLPRYQAVAIASAASIVMLAVWFTGRYWPKRMTTVAAIATLIAAFQATATAFDGDTRSSVLLGEAILLAVLGLKSRPSLYGALGFGLAGGLLAIAVHVPPSFLVLGPATQTNLPAALLSSALLLAIAILLPAIAFRTGVLENPAREAVPWIFAGFAALYATSGTLLSAALLVDGSRDGFLVGHVIITVSWTVVALLLLLRGINVRLLRVTGLVLVGAAVVKLVLFDLSALDGLARVAAFLGAGIVLLAAGTRYARMVQGSSEAGAGS